MALPKLKLPTMPIDVNKANNPATYAQPAKPAVTSSMPGIVQAALGGKPTNPNPTTPPVSYAGATPGAVPPDVIAEINRKASTGQQLSAPTADKQGIYDSTRSALDAEIKRKAENGIALSDTSNTYNMDMYNKIKEGLAAKTPVTPDEKQGAQVLGPTTDNHTWTPPTSNALGYDAALSQVNGQLDPVYIRAIEAVKGQRYQDQLDTSQIASNRGGAHSGLAADAQNKVFIGAANKMSDLDAQRASQGAEMAQGLVNRSQDNAFRDRAQSYSEWLGQQNLGLNRDQFDWGKVIDESNQTGTFNGQRNMQGQQMDRGIYENDRNYGYQVGRDARGDSVDDRNYNYQVDRDKIADKQWGQGFDLQKSQQEWENNFQQGQFDFTKAQTTWDNTFKDKSFQQSMNEAAASRGLQWASMDQRSKEFVADQAFREKQFEAENDPNSLDNKYKQAQIDEMVGTGSKRMQEEKSGLVSAYREGLTDYSKALRQINEDEQIGDYTKAEADEMRRALNIVSGTTAKADAKAENPLSPFLLSNIIK